jgi:hypothetical protein
VLSVKKIIIIGKFGGIVCGRKQLQSVSGHFSDTRILFSNFQLKFVFNTILILNHNFCYSILYTEMQPCNILQALQNQRIIPLLSSTSSAHEEPHSSKYWVTEKIGPFLIRIVEINNSVDLYETHIV